jgi:tryptophanyl-tRNA synthetase
VFATHKVFSEPETVRWADQGCRTAGIGCRDCKGRLKDRLLTVLAPISQRRAELSSDPAQIERILDDGAVRAREAADETLRIVRSRLGLGR